MIDILGLKGLRVLIITFSYLAVCVEPESSNSFFKTLFIFSGGLFYDYCSLAVVAYSEKYKNEKRYQYQRIISTIGIIISILFWVVSILGLFEMIFLEFREPIIVLRSSANFMLLSFEMSLTILLRLMIVIPAITASEIFNKTQRPIMKTETAR